MSSMYATIDRLCKEQGMNVTAMCRELGITRSALSELKAGRTRNLSSEYTAKIASFFNVSVEWLLGKTNVHDSSVKEEVPLEIRMIGRKLSRIPIEQRKQAYHLLENVVDNLLVMFHSDSESLPPSQQEP